MVHLLPPPHPPPKEKIFWKLLLSFSSLPINPFHYVKLKKKNPSTRSWVMRMRNFWAQNGPFAQIRIFSENLLTWTLFLSFMLSTCQNSKWDINLLVKYWQLKNSEILLAKSHWEPYFSQVCSFCRTLMNHKNFHLTQILDKTNDLIFLQSPKTLFLCHFWPFLVIFAW